MNKRNKFNSVFRYFLAVFFIAYNVYGYDVVVTNTKTNKSVQRIEDAKDNKLFYVGNSICSYASAKGSKSARVRAIAIECTADAINIYRAGGFCFLKKSNDEQYAQAKIGISDKSDSFLIEIKCD